MDGLTVGVATTREQVPDDFERQAAALFNAEAPSLLHLARFYVDDKTAAEDLVQEAFIRLSRSMSRVRDPRPGGGLPAVDRHQPRARPQPARARLAAPPATPVGRRALGRGGGPGPQRPSGGHRGPAGPPGRQRDCLTLRYYYDMSPADIADGLGMSVNSVKTHLQRGLRALSVALREEP